MLSVWTDLRARPHAWRPFLHSLPGWSKTAHDQQGATEPCSTSHPGLLTHGSFLGCPAGKEVRRDESSENKIHTTHFGNWRDLVWLTPVLKTCWFPHARQLSHVLFYRDGKNYFFKNIIPSKKMNSFIIQRCITHQKCHIAFTVKWIKYFILLGKKRAIQQI